MFKLKMPTDPRWVDVAEKNLEEVLTDHAYCEQKAASSAISFIVTFPEHLELVEAMADLAQEEMDHFQQVIKKMKARGFVLGRERKDPYVHDLQAFFEKGGSRKQVLVNRLLLAAMIEARSCERFRILSENLNDDELSEFYARLMKSEANHYSLFLQLAKKYGGDEIDVESIWNSFLIFEGRVMQNYGTKEQMHG
ncbi:MAG TPA: tRNA 2-methylthio-N6-isopentenyl adenosine(37) hydroxylase MiaE [Flavobacteriales bacterium]|nr:tRNA 2-methylthio-N6-isopentenyl adenosine(37) hydroxylase MiaE [Flavobacteriales bacterium]